MKVVALWKTNLKILMKESSISLKSNPEIYICTGFFFKHELAVRLEPETLK